MARLTRRDPDYRGRLQEPILAGLLHDIGMIAMPPEVVGQAGPLDDEQERLLERHTQRGGELALQLMPAAGWLAQVAAGHHEHLDGTGYHAGLVEEQLTPLIRLTAVASVYAALCSPRPYRLAKDPRTALTDTLLLAERSVLDRGQAERLLHLSFYPVGSVVELNDGSMGVVRASNLGRRDLHDPGRPVVEVLMEARGQLLPVPSTIDLAECEGRSIVRTLSVEERRKLFGQRHPELW
jgi:HD-GYP domain-containing protein (c-di-GMP phosphodiesterase class II)